MTKDDFIGIADTIPAQPGVYQFIDKQDKIRFRSDWGLEIEDTKPQERERKLLKNEWSFFS